MIVCQQNYSEVNEEEIPDMLICLIFLCYPVLGHLRIINFPFVPNGKFIILRCPKIWAHYSLIIMCLNIGTTNNHHFPPGTNGTVVVSGVPILKHLI